MMKEKTRRILPFVLAALLMLTPSSSFAANHDEAEQIGSVGVVTFTLNQAVELALRVNPRVLGERERTSEFDQLYNQAKAEAYPNLDLFFSYGKNRDPGLRNSPFFARILEGPDAPPPEALGAFFFSNYVWDIRLRQPIYTFGRVSNALDAAQSERSGINLDVRAMENQISRDTVLACYQYLLAQQNLQVLQAEKESRERQLQQVKDRFELEDATKLDLLRAEVTLANLRPEILTAENDLQVSVAAVNDTLGRPASAPIDVDAELVVPEPIPNVLRPEGLLELAGQHRPELLRYRVDREVLDSRVGVVQSNTRPQISADASFGVNTFAPTNVTSLALHTWRVAVTAEWKVFDGKKTASEIGVLRSQATQKLHDESSFRSTLSVELEQATGTWKRALEALQVTILAVDQAKEAERVSEESLKWGAATSLDVLQSSNALRQAELNQAQAAHDALVALAEMKYLVGFRADAPHEVIEASRSIAGAAADSDEQP